MNAGLPGFGLGGLFYLLSVILMVVLEAIKFFRGKKVQWKFLFSMVGITLGTLLAIFATYWCLNLISLKFVGQSASGLMLEKIGKQAKPIVWSALILFVILGFTRAISFLPLNRKSRV